MRLTLSAAAATAAVVASYGIVGVALPAGAVPAGTAPAPAATPSAQADTATSTALPTEDVGDLLVDEGHQQIFISLSSAGSVTVADLNGIVTGSIGDLTNPDDMVLSPDGGTVYVIESLASRIASIDTTTHAVVHTALPEGTCPLSLTFTGGKVWYSYAVCSDPTTGGIGMLDPGTGQAANTGLAAPWGHLRALPDRPDRMVLVEKTTGGIHVYNVSTDPPTVVVEGGDAGDTCEDAALIAGGDRVVTSCRSETAHRVYATADLTAAPSLDSYGRPTTTATTPDQKFIAVGGVHTSSDLRVYNLQPSEPTLVRTYWADTGRLYLPGVAGFAADGTLYTVTTSTSTGQKELVVFPDATRIPTSIALTMPHLIHHQQPVRVEGALYPPLQAETTVSVLRVDEEGAVDLGSIPVVIDSSFVFYDTPRGTGPVTYTAKYAGDETHLGSKGVSTIRIRPVRYDLNDDLHAEAVIGSPGENVGTVSDAGMFHVLPGGAAGVSGAGSLGIDQNTPGVPGTAEPGDRFGAASASGDFNGDGYGDIAVSAPSEDVGSATDGGAVWIFHGSATGLRTDNVRSIDVADAPLPTRSRAKFGHSLAAGDFDGDGRDDLAIGAPGAGPGYVVIAPGFPDGGTAPLTRLGQDTAGVPGASNTGDRFGWSVAAGDLNGDSRDELAVGAPSDSEDKGYSTGSVTVFPVDPSGLTGQGAQRWTKNTTGVPGGAGSYNLSKGDSPDGFGTRLAFKDLTGDERADLAVAAPGSPITVDGVRKRDAGTVTVLYSNGSALSTVGAIEISQQTAGIPGVSGQEDWFGSTLAAGHATDDRRAELAIYSPGDGYVTVIPGGLSYTGVVAWTQNSPGIPDDTEPGDRWGASLRFLPGAARSLLVGADGENSGAGALTLIPGTGSGLTGVGSQQFTQDTDGVPGTAESGDGFGSF